MRSVYVKISTRLYGWLLLAYPPQFRRQFGGEMRQTFRDCCYFEANRGTVSGFWLRTLVDLVVTAARERSDKSGREGVFMNNTRRDGMGLLVCVGIIVIAAVLHRWGIKNQVSFILVFGYALDALIVSGVIGNLIVFLLLKTTRLNPVRIAITTFAIVHAAQLLLIFIIARTDPRAGMNSLVVLSQVVSFLCWTGFHWAWHRREGMRQQEQV
jgi:hypothetical protein